MIFPVTAQMVVKNEDNYVWFAIKAVLPYVKRFLITDTGSTDKTWEIIKKINNKKIELNKSEKPVIEIRKKQLAETKTPWFLLVDGDEVWPKNQLIKLLQLTKELSKNKIAVINRTRNCVGDVWHFLPEEAGQYQFVDKKGHFNIRLMRTLGYEIAGTYPWEEYKLDGKSVNLGSKRLSFSHAWYLHLSHLLRTSGKEEISGRRKQIIERGIRLSKSKLPEVLFETRPKIVGDPLIKRSWFYELQAEMITPLKQLKRVLIQ